MAKLYYNVWTERELANYQAIFGDLVMPVDGVNRRETGWPEWAVSTRIDTAAHWHTAWEAVSRHKTQLPAYHVLERLAPEEHQVLWGSQGYYRVFSLVNGGRAIEQDLFEGLR